MHPYLALLAPVALLVPAMAGQQPAPGPADLLPQNGPVSQPAVGAALEAVDPSAEQAAQQVRIDQRVTIRIAPVSSSVRPAMLSDMRAPVPVPRFAERKMGKCVPVAGIAAVQPDAGGRLLLYMRDQRLISASLEKACSARDFYSGFYLERTKDGMLCVDRDKLRSRAGASCELGRMRQLVTAED